MSRIPPWNRALVVVAATDAQARRAWGHSAAREAERLVRRSRAAGIPTGAVEVVLVGAGRGVPGVATERLREVSEILPRVRAWARHLAENERALLVYGGWSGAEGELPGGEGLRSLFEGTEPDWGPEGLGSGRQLDFYPPLHEEDGPRDPVDLPGIPESWRGQIMGDSDGVIVWGSGAAMEWSEGGELGEGAVAASDILILTTDEEPHGAEHIIGYVGIGDAALRGGGNEEWAFLEGRSWPARFRVYPANPAAATGSGTTPLELLQARIGGEGTQVQREALFAAVTGFTWLGVSPQLETLIDTDSTRWVVGTRMSGGDPSSLPSLYLKCRVLTGGGMGATFLRYGPWYVRGAFDGALHTESGDYMVMVRRESIPPDVEVHTPVTG